MTNPEPVIDDHAWETFDLLKGLEVARLDGIWYVRHIDRKDEIEAFTPERFNELREGELG